MLSVGRWRGAPNYPVQFKRRLAAEACEAGVSISKLAMATGINTNMAFKWRRELRVGLIDDTAQAASMLVPVMLSAASVVATAATAQAVS